VERRDEKAITRRMAETRDQVAGLLQDGREPCTDDEVRVEHEAETRRMWLPKGKRWPELNKMAFWGNCCGIPGWRLRSTSYKIISCRST